MTNKGFMCILGPSRNQEDKQHLPHSRQKYLGYKNADTCYSISKTRKTTHSIYSQYFSVSLYSCSLSAWLSPRLTEPSSSTLCDPFRTAFGLGLNVVAKVLVIAHRILGTFALLKLFVRGMRIEEFNLLDPGRANISFFRDDRLL